MADLLLPGVAGDGLVARLGPRRGDMKVLYLSSDIQNTIEEYRGLSTGRGFMHKPFTVDALIQKVATMLGGAPGATRGENGERPCVGVVARHDADLGTLEHSAAKHGRLGEREPLAIGEARGEVERERIEATAVHAQIDDHRARRGERGEGAIEA